MKFTLLTYGSRGDIQPYLALAVGLKKAGHTVTLAAPHRFSNFVASYGISFAPLAGDPEEISKGFNAAGTNAFRMVKTMQDYVLTIASDVVRQARAACEGADLIVHSFLFTTGGHSLAREMGIPDVSVQIFPMFAPTRAFPNVAMPNIPPGALSYFSHWFSTQVFWHGGNTGYYRLRKTSPQDFPKKLYFPFRKGNFDTPLIFAYSPTILPKPADWTAPNIHVTGYFFLENDSFEPSEELSRFLESGDPPVAISFGSMVNAEAERIHDAIVSALNRTGKRGIFLTGWGQKKPEHHNPNMHYIPETSHDFLFPKCQAVIHHGGAGTTAAGLQAGIPNIVVPHAADQFFWAKRVAAINCGSQPIPIQSVSGDSFINALTISQKPAIRAQAQAVGRKIQAENGVETAIRVIESVL